MCNLSSRPFRLAALGLLFALSTLLMAQTQQPQPAITLVKPTTAAPAASAAASSSGNSRVPKSDISNFEDTKLGQSSSSQLFTLEFHQTTKLTTLASTPDFKITGGSCMEGHTYISGDKCSVDIVFTPKGPGHRLGHLTVAHSAAIKPFTSYFGGTSYGPTVSFVPSLISTVPGTYKGTPITSAGGVLLTPQSLAIDGGDNLYIADTGNRLIRFVDSSGALAILAGGGTMDPTNTQGTPTLFALNTPYGVTVDPFGTVYFSDFALNQVYQITQGGDMDIYVGYGTGNVADCTYTAPCQNSFTANIQSPNALAVDPYGNLFVNLPYGQETQYYPGSSPLEVLNSIDADYFTIESGSSVLSTTNPIAVDGEDNLFYTDEDPGVIPNYDTTPKCRIEGQNQAASYDIAGQQTFIVAGSGPCGFSGDGGKATGAQISNNVLGLTFDLAGNLYFTDAGNNRVRRIDAATGIIRTVAGNGSAGFGGDGGPATSATLNTPTGIAVDSQGQIYTTNYAYSSHEVGTPYPADIRVIGTTGALTFPSQATGTKSAAQKILVSNTGNGTLNFTNVAISSGNASDFTLDPITTSCNFAQPLDSGDSCYIGVFFTPAAAGTRTSTITLTDNTINGGNIIQLTGTGAAATTPAKGALSPTSLAFASQSVGTASAAKTITLSNSGTPALGITSFSFIGTNATDFAQTNTCGTSVAGSGSCTISVVFTPAAAGARSASLTVVTASGTLTAALTGTGTSTTTGGGVFKPSSLTFAAQTVGTASATQVLALTNTGATTLTLSGYTLGGANPTSFTQTHTCGVSITGGGSCTYTVTFKPTAAGALTATLTANTGGGPVTATLSGTGTAASVVKAKVTLASSANPAAAGQAIALRTQVASTSKVPATGKVELKEGATVLATGTLSGGIVTFRLMSLSAGTHTFQAHYLGDTHNPPQQSPAFQQIIAAGRKVVLP